MKMKATISLFCCTVLLLASTAMASPVVSTSTSAKTQGTQSKTKVSAAPAATPTTFGLLATVSRSTSLVDFQDGSKSDSMDYLFRPSGRFSFGTVSLSIGYSQDLRDDSERAADWSDASLSWSLNPTKLNWPNKEQSARLTYSLSAIIPVSKNSRIRDELQTSVSGSLGFAVAPVADGFSYGARVSLGRNFHSYSENINGSVLNQYSSNQSLNAGYTYGNWDLSLSFTNMARWSYQGNVRSSFDLSEELTYSFNKNFSLAVGHTNSGSNLKPNGIDTNISLFNENSSLVYATLGIAY